MFIFHLVRRIVTPAFSCLRLPRKCGFNLCEWGVKVPKRSKNWWFKCSHSFSEHKRWEINDLVAQK